MSQKNCSLAFDESEIEIDGEIFEPNLKIFIKDTLVRNSATDNIIYVEGGITVSF